MKRTVREQSLAEKLAEQNRRESRLTATDPRNGGQATGGKK
ncbi:hypothetical protein ACWEU6_22005 [Streptosporangium sandarakinum]